MIVFFAIGVGNVWVNHEKKIKNMKMSFLDKINLQNSVY